MKMPDKSKHNQTNNIPQRESWMSINPGIKWLKLLLMLPLKMILQYICAFSGGSFTLVCNTFWACSMLCSLIPPHAFGVIISKKCDSVQSVLTLSISSYSGLSLTSSSHNIFCLLFPKVNVCWVHILFPFWILILLHVWACSVILHLLNKQVISN